MKKIAIVGAALLGASCGGKQGGGTIGSRGGAKHGPALVFVGIGPSMMFEAGCFAATGPDCDALRTASMDGKQEVKSGGATFRITGTVSDECDASGATDVVGIERVSGPEDTSVTLATYPAGVDVGLETYAAAGADETSPVILVTDDMRAALARVATADLAKGENPRKVEAGEIVVEQVVRTDVSGDGKPDAVFAANVPMSDDAGPGYVWSALVVAPGGDLAAAASVWTSDLEHMTIDASFDLEGDGPRELVWSAEYYEGGGRGTAAIKDGKLEILGQWGCGA